MPEIVKQSLDFFAAGVAVGAIIKVLPAIAAVLSIIWLSLRIWESDTVREWTGRNR